MNEDPNTLDRLARRLVQASEKDLRHSLGVTRLDPALVARLYLHVRGVIERCEEEGAVDELALAIYLTASAWQSNAAAPVDLLTSLHTVIGTTLDAEMKAALPVTRPGEPQSRKESS